MFAASGIMNTRAQTLARTALFALLASLAAAQTPRPNIVFILLDDLDYADVGVYGSPDIQTPNIDAFAASAMRFTRFYSAAPICSPSRVAILTGRHPSEFGIQQAIDVESFRGIPGDVMLFPQVLHDAGYHTAHLGKWHVGSNRTEFLPTRRGFDHSVRRIESTFYTDFEASIDDGPPQRFNNGEYLTSFLTDRAVEFVRDAPQPFLLNLWYLAPHAPLNVPDGYDNSQTQYDLSSDRGKFSAMVSNVDRQLQRVLDALAARGVADETVVIIASDNGGASFAHQGVSRPFRGFKKDVFDGGIRVPLMIRQPGVTPAGAVNESPISALDLFPTLADIAGVDVSALGLRATSLTPLLASNASRTLARPLFWENSCGADRRRCAGELFNRFAVRDRSWKFVSEHGREFLFDMDNDPAERSNLGDQFPAVADRLRCEYDHWRAHTGRIDYVATLSESGVRVRGNRLFFSGGTATVASDSRLDRHDGGFSFIARVNAQNDATIAEKPGSWSLEHLGGAISLHIQGETGGEVTLAAPDLTAGEHHVAFTVFAWKVGDSSVRLYVDGLLIAESNDGIRAIAPSDAPLLIGNNADGTAPLIGEVELPRLSVLQRYNAEVIEDFAPSACSADLDCDLGVGLSDLSVLISGLWTGDLSADLDHDDDVDLADLEFLLTAFGTLCPQ